LRNLREYKGQSLVEYALLLPLICFTLAGLLQLFFLIWTQMHFQQAAARVAYQTGIRVPKIEITTELTQNSQSPLPWGYFDPINTKSRTLTLAGWQAYTGVATLDKPATLATIDLTYRFFPRFLFRWVHSATAHCEFPMEPQIWGDQG
jgi:hypothetical protein